MTAAVFGFPECTAEAGRLAADLRVPLLAVAVHRFPDGESLVRVDPPPATAILYRSLDDPNVKLVELLFAASALRDGGAQRLVLVAPYMAYMRQDKAFGPGEAVSQRVIGSLLSEHFDAVLTVDPHLHRIRTLSEVMPGIEAVSISAAPALSESLAGEGNDMVLVGPDGESRQWVEAIATPLGLDVLVGAKQRNGDRNVEIAIDGVEAVKGRRALLVDDVISSGETLIAAAGLLRSAGARRIEALATHCLGSAEDLERITRAGIERIRATDTVASPAAAIPIAGLLADAIRVHGWTGD